MALNPSRIILKPPSEEDDEQVAQLRSHPETLRYLEFFPTVFSVEDARRRRETRKNDGRIVDLVIHLINPGPDGSTFIGTCGLFDIDHDKQSAEAGILLSPTRHRTGLGTEALYLLLNYAFDEVHVHRIVFQTAHNNVQMRGWFENVLKIEPEFRLKEGWKAVNGWTDVIGYRILDYEWRDGLRTLVKLKIKPAS